jgi:peptidoglycan/LPS O-acetylase OafA/YrhL
LRRGVPPGSLTIAANLTLASPSGSQAGAPRLRGHVPGLDGVRGLAILITVLHNSGTILQSGPDVSWVIKVATTITWSGWVGVQLFFVLSGFLITGILLEQRETPHYFRNFYIRRALRIFPVYYLTLTIAFLVVPLFASPQYGDLVKREGIWYWTYLSNWTGSFGHRIRAFNHFWSLALEEQFYLVWPLIVAVTGGRIARICVTLLATAFGFRVAVLGLGLDSGLAYAATIARADSLAAGAMLALVVRDAELYRRVRRWVAPVAIATAIITCGLALWRKGFAENDPVILVFGQTLIIGPCLWLIAAAQRSPEERPAPLQRFFESPALRSLGRYSYAMYVVHWPLHYWAATRLAPWVNQGDTVTRLAHQAAYVAGILMATTVLAIASWELIEKRILALKERLAPLVPNTA